MFEVPNETSVNRGGDEVEKLLKSYKPRFGLKFLQYFFAVRASYVFLAVCFGIVLKGCSKRRQTATELARLTAPQLLHVFKINYCTTRDLTPL